MLRKWYVAGYTAHLVINECYKLPNGDQSESIETQSSMLRKRLLAQKLAREKQRAEMQGSPLHLGEPTGEPSHPPVLAPSRSGPDHSHTPPSTSPNQAMEDRLRNLVLKTKKIRQSGLETTSTGSSSSSSPLIHLENPSPSLTPTTTPSVTENADDNLDNLAVSVIQQAIETAKAQKVPPMPSLRSPGPLPVMAQNILPKSGPTSFGAAAKVAQLDEDIKETKRLMAMIDVASSKQEKNALLQRLREITRCVRLSNISFFFRFLNPPILISIRISQDLNNTSKPSRDDEDNGHARTVSSASMAYSRRAEHFNP